MSYNDNVFPSCWAKHLCVVNNDGVIDHSVAIIGLVNYSPIFRYDNDDIGNAVMSLGDVRFSITRISMGQNPHTSNRALCIEWSADGKDFKSYIDTTNEDYA